MSKTRPYIPEGIDHQGRLTSELIEETPPKTGRARLGAVRRWELWTLRHPVVAAYVVAVLAFCAFVVLLRLAR